VADNYLAPIPLHIAPILAQFIAVVTESLLFFAEFILVVP
jgi:hypothetical protein